LGYLSSYNEKNIIVTGNTVIDALLWTLEKLKDYHDDEIQGLENIVDTTKKLILVTGHRRENFGEGFLNICKAIKQVSEAYDDVQIIYPVHLNPNVQRPVYELLSGLSNIKLISPLTYPAFVWLMNKSYLILTDSGGVQEEAPSLGKPVLVMRETTERPEAVAAGTVKMVGTDVDKITFSITELLKDKVICQKFSIVHNPYGNGRACERIIKSTNKDYA
jgi:UDP-N-acetylglucosamine 2-epimerase (non-hydrolysing)